MFGYSGVRVGTGQEPQAAGPMHLINRAGAARLKTAKTQVNSGVTDGPIKQSVDSTVESRSTRLKTCPISVPDTEMADYVAFYI